MVFRLSIEEQSLLLSDDLPEEFREAILLSIERLCSNLLEGKFPERTFDKQNRENVIFEAISIYLHTFRLRFPSKNSKQDAFAKELYKNLPELIGVEANKLKIDVDRLRFDPHESLPDRLRRRLAKWRLFVKMLKHVSHPSELTC